MRLADKEEKFRRPTALEQDGVTFYGMLASQAAIETKLGKRDDIIQEEDRRVAEDVWPLEGKGHAFESRRVRQ